MVLSRDKLKEIFKKKIVIWGCGKSGHEFYQKHKDWIDIWGMTANLSISKIKEFTPSSLHPLCHDEIDFKNSLVVICSSAYGAGISAQLSEEGLQLHINYIFDDEFDALFHYAFYNTKLIVGIGWCDIKFLCSALQNVSAFSSCYSVIGINEVNASPYDERFDASVYNKCVDLVSTADFLLCSDPLTGSRLSFYNDIFKLKNETCEIVNISLPEYFFGYWPQFLNNKKYNQWDLLNHHTSYAPDRIIIDSIGRNMDRDSVIHFCMASPFSSSETKYAMDFSLKQIQVLDKFSKIKMSDFYFDNYDKVWLFKNPGHMGNELFSEYVYRTGSFFGINIDMRERDKVKKYTPDGMSDSPIYPQVEDDLSLSFLAKDQKYRVRNSLVSKKVIKEFCFKDYISWLYDFYIFEKEYEMGKAH